MLGAEAGSAVEAMLAGYCHLPFLISGKNKELQMASDGPN